AYVNGEGRWSKAEGQAIAELREYGHGRRTIEYRHFRDQLAVPLGDRVARLELQSAAPDLNRARQGFLVGRNNPADIAGMIRMFRLFGSSSLMAPSIRFWTGGDELILELADIGEQLHAEVSTGHPSQARVQALLDQAERVHVQVGPLEDGFSAALGLASRQV